MGIGVVRAGALFAAITAVAVFFAFTKMNPFSNPYELKAVFQSSMNLKKQTSQVRIAGVEVGRVAKIEPLQGRATGALVTMQIERSGLPIHSDAQLKIRQQLFLEGNYFVDLKPGSPSAPDLKSGSVVPVQQTAIPVQFGDVLAALQSDTRSDLKTAVQEYGLKALNGGGAQGVNNSIPYWEPAYKNASLVNDAMLGQRPGDLHRVELGQQQTLAALSSDTGALQGLITNLNITAGAFAREDRALRAAIPALRDTLRIGSPALRTLNGSLPSVSRFARDALPGVRSSGPTIDALIPFVHQLRALVQPSELRGLVADLRPTVPALARLNVRTVPILSESRSMARCSNRVLIPFGESPIPNPDEPWNNNQLVMRQLPRSLVGLSGESRITDANTPMFRVNFSGATQGFFGGGPSQGGAVAALPGPVAGTRPALPQRQPPHRPDVPCETQQPPNLNAPAQGAFGNQQPLTNPAIPLDYLLGNNSLAGLNLPANATPQQIIDALKKLHP
jgi:phospholipid/cholesterol/gamma-HCH transport system substrate-binding protein